MSKIKSGLAIHCHHNILLEFCYDYNERVKRIKENKPANEQEIRLRLFRLLPKEAIAELPFRFVKANADRAKAYADLANADANWSNAYADRAKANDNWSKAYADWAKADREAWHKKWCGCEEWDGMKLTLAVKEVKDECKRNC